MVRIRLHIASLCSFFVFASLTVEGQQLESIFPSGMEAGKSQEIALTGKGLEELIAVQCSASGLSFRKGVGEAFIAHGKEVVQPGLYDLQVLGRNGLSSPRSFYVTTRPHVVEQHPDSVETAIQPVSLGCTISGRIAKGDVDSFRFHAVQGEKVVIECWADRIDSALRAVLELVDSDGKRLAVSRGYFGVDPLIAYTIPEEGDYIASLHDLVYGGGVSHFYRLDVSCGPRVVFALPPVVERGRETEVTLHGWNLAAGRAGSAENSTVTPHGKQPAFETASVRITAPASPSELPVQRAPAANAVETFAYLYPGADVPIPIGVTDLPVSTPQDFGSTDVRRLEIPSAVVGQLASSGDRDRYAIDVRRGEVLYFEAFGDRIGSPVDLDITVLDVAEKTELAAFHDEVPNVGGVRFPSNHLDPSGRWVVPADGTYHIMVRDLIGGIHADPRRVYRLSVRREEPDVQLVAIAHSESPAGTNLSRGGRAVVDVLAFRRRGMTGSIRVTAHDLPPGVTCPDIWIGPGVDRAPLVLSAEEDAAELVTTLPLRGYFDSGGGEMSRRVQAGTMIRSGLPNGSGRLMAQLPLAISNEAPLQISAHGHEPRNHHLYGDLKVRHSPGGILDVAVTVLRRQSGHEAPVTLTAVGLPEMVRNQVAKIPAGKSTGYISFYLPPSLPVGTYTIAIRAETTTLRHGEEQPHPVAIYSDAVTFELHPPAFRLDLDVAAPSKIKRGEIVEVKYTSRRVNGFISKIHTELAAPGKVTVVGPLRGRGVTSVGQTESGTIQIIANADAALGKIPFLRLYAVGVLEDEAVFHGSCFLGLEIVE